MKTVICKVCGHEHQCTRMSHSEAALKRWDNRGVGRTDNKAPDLNPGGRNPSLPAKNPICDRCDVRDPHPPHDERDDFHPSLPKRVIIKRDGTVRVLPPHLESVETRRQIPTDSSSATKELDALRAKAQDKGRRKQAIIDAELPGPAGPYRMSGPAFPDPIDPQMIKDDVYFGTGKRQKKARRKP